MAILSEGTVAAIFVHLADFLRKTGKLEIFDTLVYNYRLKEKLSENTLQQLSCNVLELVTTIKDLLNFSTTDHTLSKIQKSFSTNQPQTKNADRNLRPVSGNSVEINWKGNNKTRNQRGIVKCQTKEIKNAGCNENQSNSSLAAFVECDLCPEPSKLKFTSMKFLNRHKRTVHPESNAYNCVKCDASFRFRQSLRKHVKRRHEIQKYPCPSCDEVFERRILLTNHRFKNHNEIKKCPQCQTVCSTDAGLSAHIALKHSSGNPPHKKFQCTICPKEFARKDQLQFHIAVHTGDKPFTCSTCGKGFSRKFKLDDHEARHLNVKKYVCKYPDCAKAYASNQDLRVHLKNQHGEKIDNPPTVRRKRVRKAKTAPAVQELEQNSHVDTQMVQSSFNFASEEIGQPSQLQESQSLVPAQTNHGGDGFGNYQTYASDAYHADNQCLEPIQNSFMDGYGVNPAESYGHEGSEFVNPDYYQNSYSTNNMDWGSNSLVASACPTQYQYSATQQQPLLDNNVSDVGYNNYNNEISDQLSQSQYEYFFYQEQSNNASHAVVHAQQQQQLHQSQNFYRMTHQQQYQSFQASMSSSNAAMTMTCGGNGEYSIGVGMSYQNQSSSMTQMGGYYPSSS